MHTGLLDVLQIVVQQTHIGRMQFKNFDAVDFAQVVRGNGGRAGVVLQFAAGIQLVNEFEVFL